MDQGKTNKLIILFLGLNLALGLLGQGVMIYNQEAINRNQQITISYLDQLTEFVGQVGGELVETAETEFNLDIHFEVIVTDKDTGIRTDYAHHAGTLTTLGGNWIKEQLGSNVTRALGLYITLSDDAGAPSAAWVVLPNEISTNNMSRRLGTFSSLGDGQYRIEVEFNPTGSGTFQLGGLNYRVTTDGLICADQTTQVSYTSTSTVICRWDVTIS